MSDATDRPGPSEPLRFACTSCGRCCHGLRLALGVGEALAWAARGGLVQILCHAGADVGDVEGQDAYRRARSFVARSGAMPIRVQVLLVARFEGACPNLQPDMRCGIYRDRPNVCRIYPAEILPGRIVNPADRLCPPEAWSAGQPLLLREDGSAADRETKHAVTEARASSLSEVSARYRLVAHLGIDVAALENEAFAVWTLPTGRLVEALRMAMEDGPDLTGMHDWRFMSARSETRALIEAAGAHVTEPGICAEPEYLPLY